MFKSVLNAGTISIDSLILDIFIILGVVVAGALIVYFVWEALNVVITRNQKTKDEIPNFAAKEPENVEQFVLSPEKEEKEPEKAEATVLDEQKLTTVDETKAEEEQKQAESEISEEERLNAERRAYLEARRQELIRRMQAEMSDDEEEETEEETESETQDKQDEEQPSEVAEQTEEVVEEEEPKTDNLAEEREALSAERARYEEMIKELEEAKRALAEQNAKEAKTEVIVETRYKEGALTLEELKARLANAQERLEKTEKEFKQCKKEYIPLRKIWNAYERDEKKLRRKEALVARQKVLLYGVNNFADIDEEKAKKLAEDLDHLDGLKLSVQHCQEVMAENAERYPLLEKMYGVLNQRNEELKKDIETYKKEIARIEAESEEE